MKLHQGQILFFIKLESLWKWEQMQEAISISISAPLIINKSE